jgi:hypothetical protein
MDDFKFCLTLKALHPEEQREAWIRRRAEWWANRRLSKSSEDVWDIRECVFRYFAVKECMLMPIYSQRAAEELPTTSVDG